MPVRYRILIAIEKNELLLWSLAERALLRSGPGLEEALEWARRAQRARKEEISFLTQRARAASVRTRSTSAAESTAHRESAMRLAS